MSSSVEPCPQGQLEGMPLERLLRFGLVPVPVAAESLGISPKRLRGYIWTENSTGKLKLPIGDFDQDMVYGWSLKTLAETLADVNTAAT